MKKMIRIALALVLALSVLISSALAQEVVSDTFKLTEEVTIKAEPTPAPTAEAEQPAEPTEQPLPTEPPLPTAEPQPTEQPLPTEQPQPTEQPLPTEPPQPTEPAPTLEASQPAESPLPTQEAPVAPERSVSLTIDKPLDAIFIGDALTFTAVLHGYEGAQVEIFWERMVNGEWQPTGATGETMTVLIDESNAQSSWRCGVTVLAEPQPAAEPVAQPAAQ